MAKKSKKKVIWVAFDWPLGEPMRFPYDHDIIVSEQEIREYVETMRDFCCSATNKAKRTFDFRNAKAFLGLEDLLSRKDVQEAEGLIHSDDPELIQVENSFVFPIWFWPEEK